MQKIAFGFGFAVAAFAKPDAHVEMFEIFMQTFGRKYEAEEKMRRLEIFQSNMQMIEASNAKNLPYTLGVTPFTDLTFEEFRAQFVGGMTKLTEKDMQNMTKFERPVGFTAPESVDWVEKGAVSSVKNQGHCGSCWTFSATGALEGAMKVAGRDLVDLSQQELVSCDTGLIGGHGCNGGNPAQAFGWVKSHGMCSAADYPYVCVDAEADVCKEATCTKCTTPVLKAGGWITSGDVISYGMVKPNSTDLEAAVARQPISVAIQADTAVFQHYKSGVLTDTACGQNIDHAVLAVGFGVEASQEYWKVKNSWSASWGEDGYVRLAKGVKEDYGECGIRTMATYPTVKPVTEVVV